MLYVDSRAGSKDFLKPLQKLLGAEKVESTLLEFGDISFTGRGVEDKSLDIGVEHKTIGDIAQCCRDGRFAGHQMPGMRKMYDHSWLLVEGQWRSDEAGYVTTYQGRRGWRMLPGKMRASELEKHLLTFELCGGMRVHTTNTRADSVRFIGDLYRWFTDRSLDSHTSHLAVHQPAVLAEVSPFRRAIMAWPGIGLQTSQAIEETFHGSIRQAVQAPADRWASIRTHDRAWGRERAERLAKFLDGR